MELSIAIGPGQAMPRPGVSVLGALPGLTLTSGAAMTPADLSAGFSGSGLGFALAPASAALPAGLALSAAGLLSGTPAAAAGPLGIVIRAANAQASADSGFSLTVTDVLLDFTASLTGLTANPTHGPSAQTGATLTAAASGFSAGTPGSVAYQWKTAESGAILGATAAAFAPDAALYDGETLYCTVVPQGYPAKDTPGSVVRHAPPAAAGLLPEEIYDIGTGPQPVAAGADFTGAALAYSVTGPGCAVDAATGDVTIRTDSATAGAVVTVTALNSGGAATSAFPLTVEDPDFGPGPDLSAPVLDDAADTIGLTVSEPATLYWRRDPAGTNADAGDVITGGGFDSGAFAVSAGPNSVPIAFAPGNDGVQEIAFVAAAIPDEPSLVRTAAIEIDTADPVLAGASPAAGATGVDPAVTPVLTFSEPVSAASGTVTLWDTTLGAATEIFDVITNAGTAAGQVEIAGSALTIRPSAQLTAGYGYAVLIDAGAVRDLAGNPFAGIAGTGTLAFSAGIAPVIDTDFGAAFPTAHASVWASMQANPYNGTAEHRPSETWDAYPATVTDGGVVTVKAGNYPQIRFAVPVTAGKSYLIDADFPVGEGTWSGPLRVKIGSGLNLSDYAQIDDTEAGQPRVVELRGQPVTATTADLWFAVIVQTSGGGISGGDPAIAMLRITEV